VQRDVEILGRHREQVLREILAGVGVELAAHQAADVGELNGGEPGAAAEHHVLLGVRGAGKPRRCLVRAHQVVDGGRDHGCQGVAHDDHLQPVGERRPQHIVVHLDGRPAGLRRSRRGDTGQCQQGGEHGRRPRPVRS